MNISISKLLVCGKIVRGEHLNLGLKGEVLEEVDTFKF